MSLTQEQRQKWIELVCNGFNSYEFLRQTYEPSKTDWKRAFLKDKKFDPPLSDATLEQLYEDTRRASIKFALAGDEETLEAVAKREIDWQEVEATEFFKKTRRPTVEEAVAALKTGNPIERKKVTVEQSVSGDANRLCSFWTPFFAVLPRFLSAAVPVALIPAAGFYGAFYCSGFACIIGWLALILGVLIEFVMASVFVSGCRRMQKMTKRALDSSNDLSVDEVLGQIRKNVVPPDNIGTRLAAQVKPDDVVRTPDGQIDPIRTAIAQMRADANEPEAAPLNLADEAKKTRDNLRDPFKKP